MQFPSVPFNSPKVLIALHTKISGELEKLEGDKNALAGTIQEIKTKSAKGFAVKSAHECQQLRWSHLEREIALRNEIISFLEGDYKTHVVELSRVANEKPASVQAELKTGFERLGFPTNEDQEGRIPETFYRYHPRFRQALQDADFATDLVGRIGSMVNTHLTGIADCEERMEKFRDRTLQLA